MPHPKVSDLLDPSLTTLLPETDIADAIETLLKKGLSGAPVIDADRRLVGILSEKDCLRVVAAEAFDRLPEGRVADHMTQDVVTLASEGTVLDAVDLFLKTSFRRIPVLGKGGQILGVVSRTRVLQAVASLRNDVELYRSPESTPPEDTGGVDSAMKRARSR